MEINQSSHIKGAISAVGHAQQSTRVDRTTLKSLSQLFQTPSERSGYRFHLSKSCPSLGSWPNFLFINVRHSLQKLFVAIFFTSLVLGAFFYVDLQCPLAAAVELAAAEKEFMIAAPLNVKFGIEDILGFGQITLFIHLGSRRNHCAVIPLTQSLQAIFSLWSNEEGKQTLCLQFSAHYIGWCKCKLMYIH